MNQRAEIWSCVMILGTLGINLFALNLQLWVVAEGDGDRLFQAHGSHS